MIFIFILMALLFFAVVFIGGFGLAILNTTLRKVFCMDGRSILVIDGAAIVFIVLILILVFH